mgnify:CR=1 FL=1
MESKIFNTDCLETLSLLSDNSVDLLVTDPPYGISFMGSGTTGIACKLLNREFIGCEINKEYLEIAQKRMGSIPNKFDI